MDVHFEFVLREKSGLIHVTCLPYKYNNGNGAFRISRSKAVNLSVVPIFALQVAWGKRLLLVPIILCKASGLKRATLG